MSETNTDPNTPNNVTPITEATSAVAQATQEAPTPQYGPKMTLSEYADQPAPTEQVVEPEAPQKQKAGLRLAHWIGATGAAALLAINAMGSHTDGKDVPKEEVPAVLQDASVDFRTVQPGETLSGTAERVAENINDNLPAEQQVTTEQTVDAIVDMNNEMAVKNDQAPHMQEKSNLTAGDNLYLPGEGDGNPNKAGYQLNPTDEAK